jgi:hypothetical protein
MAVPTRAICRDCLYEERFPTIRAAETGAGKEHAVTNKHTVELWREKDLPSSYLARRRS